MKIGILTITDGANYGNRLQNFALQEFLKEMDLEVKTIRRSTTRDIKGYRKGVFLFKEYIKKILGITNTSFYARERKRRFESFNNTYISFSEVCLSDNKAPETLKDDFDYFICGSDQIWNAHFDIVSCDISNYLASFANPTQRIAFAASFGTNKVALGYEDIFKEELKKFKAIAVREDAGAKIVEELIGEKDVQVVLDPTLLIEKQKWINIEKKPNYVEDEKFILTYFLSWKTPNMNQYIYDLAFNDNLRVISLDIEFLTDDMIINRDMFQTTPAEFVWLIHHATYVLTDSFHASVFAIIFERPFLVFDRVADEKNNDMGSRIDTLLEKFQLRECRDNIENPTKYPKKQDYTNGYKQIEKERDIAKKFLEEALSE